MADRIQGLKIVLGADASELIKAVSNVNKELKSTQTNLRDVNKALKLDPTNINLLKDKQRELTNAISESKEKLDAEKNALETMKANGVSETSKEFQDLKTQIDIDEAALKNLEKQMREFGTASAAQLKAVGKEMQDVGNKIASVGTTLTTTVTVPIATGFAAAIKTTADFESQMSKVQAISGATSEEMAVLEAKSREMGATTKFSATEAGQALEYMAMAGWKTEQMTDGLAGIMNLAAASGEELGTTSDIVTDALTAFGMTAAESGRLADILASASSNANTNVSMMGESFKYAAAPAGTLGYSAEDVAVALGLMANSGIKADMAGTSLRNMFQRLAKPTKESYNAMVQLGLSIADSEGNAYSFREIMDQIRTTFADVNVDLDLYNESLDGLDSMLEEGKISQEEYDELLKQINVDLLGSAGSEKARYAAMLGGTRAMSGLLAIANATEEDYQKLITAVDGSSESFAKLKDGSVVPLSEALASGQEIIEQYNGAAEAMAKTMEDNLEGDITKLKSAAQELAISVGELLMPLAKEIVAKIQSIVDYMNSLDESTKQRIVTIAGIVAAVGPVLLVVGKLVVGIGSVVSAIGTISAAITAAIPIITGVVATITGTVIPALVAVVVPILPIVAAIAAVIAIIVVCIKHWDEIKEATQKAVEKMKEAWTKFKEDVSRLWDNLKTNVNNAANNIHNGVTTKFNNIKSSVVNKVSEMKNSAVNTFNSMRSSISSSVGNIKTAIVNGFSSAVSYITSLPSRAIGWGRDIINGIVDGIWSAIGRVRDAMSDIASTISSYIHFSEPDEGALSNFHTYMPDMMKQLAQGIENGIPGIERAMDNMTRSMIPTMGGVSGNDAVTNNTNTVSINVYGAQGQDINELANIIEQKITNNVVRRGVAFT